MPSENYWWAEYVIDGTRGWRFRPVLQCDGFVVTCDGPWFQTKEDCLDFMRREFIGATVEDD